MKFVVCIKQVPDVNAPLQIRDGELILETGRMVLNAYDASAVEEALVLTEKYGGTVDLVLVGPQKAQETIRKALAMGADAATHIVVENAADLDSTTISGILADFVVNVAYDVIACGKQSQDTDAGLTGPMVAQRLGLPYASNAVGLDIEDAQLIVTRQGDTGQEVIALPTPCLVTCSNDMNDPRIPSLKGIMKAKRKKIAMQTAENATAGGTTVLRYEPIPEREPGRMFEGPAEEIAATVADLLTHEAKVL